MAEARQFCTFLLGSHLFGVELEQVQELIGYREVTRVPLAPRAVSGLVNFHGLVIPVIDLRRRLDLDERPVDMRPMHVVVRTDEGAVDLLVDEVKDVVEIEENTLECPPVTLKEMTRAFIRGAHRFEDRLLLVLDQEKAVQESAG